MRQRQVCSRDSLLRHRNCNFDYARASRNQFHDIPSVTYSKQEKQGVLQKPLQLNWIVFPYPGYPPFSMTPPSCWIPPDSYRYLWLPSSTSSFLSAKPAFVQSTSLCRLRGPPDAFSCAAVFSSVLPRPFPSAASTVQPRSTLYPSIDPPIHYHPLVDPPPPLGAGACKDWENK